MSVPVWVSAGLAVCVQDVVELVAGLAVWVYATERGGRIRTCVLTSVVSTVGVCVSTGLRWGRLRTWVPTSCERGGSTWVDVLQRATSRRGGGDEG